MSTLTDEMKRMLGAQLAILATVTDGTTPNIGPKRSLRVRDDRSLIFNENTGGQTLANIHAGSKVSVAVIDREALDGYRFVGSAQIHESGPAFDNAVAFAQERGMKHPRCAVVIDIEDIYTLKPGAGAGKRVWTGGHG